MIFFKNLPPNVLFIRDQIDGPFIFPEIEPHRVAILRPGWLHTQLINNDSYTWKRWQFLDEIRANPELANTRQIPPIDFALSMTHSPTMQMLEYCLKMIPIHEDWDRDNRGWDYLEYFMDWLLYGFGHHSQPLPPKEPAACLGASNRLYQAFQLMPLQAWPNDYFGEILFNSEIGKEIKFTLDSHYSCASSCYEALCDGQNDKPVYLPLVSTGRYLLHASNYRLFIIGQDLDQTLLKIALVNCYLYAPWIVEPPPKIALHSSWVGNHILPEHQSNSWYRELAQSVEKCSEFLTEQIARVKFNSYVYYAETEFDEENWWRYAPFCKRKYKDVPEMPNFDLIHYGGKRCK